MDALGPYSDVDVIAVGTTIPEINQLLAQGWRLLSIAIMEEQLTTGTAGRPPIRRRVAVGAVGRKLQPGEDAVTIREQADEQSEDAIAASTISVPEGVSVDEGQVSDTPEATQDPPQPAPMRRVGERKIAKGQGEFAATGVRG